jgi:hypothetical protein
MLERADRKIKVAMERLERLIATSPRELRSEVLGLMGSAEKRFAEVVYWSWKASPGRENPLAEQAREFRAHLKRARDYYWRCFQQEKTGTGWAMVQYIVLSIVIDAVAGEPDAEPAAAPGEDASLAALWVTAEQLSRSELSVPGEVRGWALGNLIELNLIVSQVPTLSTWPGVEQRLEVARAYTRQLAETNGPTPSQRFQIYSTRRQLKRYAWWFGRIPALQGVQAAAEELLALLPEVVV